MKRTKVSIKFAVLALAFFAFVAVNAQAPKQEQLLNGLKVYMWPAATADSVTVRIRIHAGSAFDPQGKEGVMQLLADNLFPDNAAREFFTEDLGGGLDVSTTYDYIQITAASKPDQYLTMLETLASAVSNPVIDKETTAKVRAALIDRLKAYESDPAYVADRAAAQRLLGTFPYGRPQMGTSGSIGKIGFADLIDAKQRFLTADNASIAISGNFDRNTGFKAIRRYFGSWLKSDRRIPSTFKQPEEALTSLFTVASPRPNVSAVRSAIRGASRGSKDLGAAEIYARLLETRLKARVPAEFAKDVFVRSESYVQPGLITIGLAATKNDIGSTNGKIDASDLIAKAMTDPITESEFNAARAAASAAWQKRAVEEFWLDADTYKIASVEADRSAINKVTISDLRAFADRMRQQPIATVLLNTPAK